MTPRVGRREWDSNLEAVFRGLYHLILFEKIESYLTFLNVPQLERQGADLQTKIEELRIINQSLRENGKVKEDVLAHLSDRLLILSERIQQLERKQIL